MGVIKRPDSDYWYIEFIYNGRRYKASSGTTDKTKARAIEAKMRAELLAGNDPSSLPKITLAQAIVRYIDTVIRWSRRHQATTATTWRWAVLTGLAGWPILLVFFVHADLSHLVTCATCGRKRALSAERCGACGAPWPAQPQRDQQGFVF